MYVTGVVRDIVLKCDVVVGYRYTLMTIEDLLRGKEVHEITMGNPRGGVSWCSAGAWR